MFHPRLGEAVGLTYFYLQPRSSQIFPKQIHRSTMIHHPSTSIFPYLPWTTPAHVGTSHGSRSGHYFDQDQGQPQSPAVWWLVDNMILVNSVNLGTHSFSGCWLLGEKSEHQTWWMFFWILRFGRGLRTSPGRSNLIFFIHQGVHSQKHVPKTAKDKILQVPGCILKYENLITH